MAQSTFENINDNILFNGFVNLRRHIESTGLNVPSISTIELSSLLNATHVKMVAPTEFKQEPSCHSYSSLTTVTL